MENDQTIRNKIIERCKKLAQMTVTKGCSEAEAMAAAQILSKLVESYNITQDEIQIRADAQGCISDSFIELNLSRAEWTNTCVAIMSLFSVRCIFSTETDEELGFTFQKIVYYGFPLDTAGAIALSSIIANAIASESVRFEKTTKSIKKVFDFRLGMADRIKERIFEIQRIRNLNRDFSNRQALVVLKTDLVDKEYHKAYPHLGPAREIGSGRRRDELSYNKGQMAGDKVNLTGDGQVSGHRTSGLLS